jgi:hypothetical protein
MNLRAAEVNEIVDAALFAASVEPSFVAGIEWFAEAACIGGAGGYRQPPTVWGSYYSPLKFNSSITPCGSLTRTIVTPGRFATEYFILRASNRSITEDRASQSSAT